MGTYGKLLIKIINKLKHLKKYLMLFKIQQMHKEHIDKYLFCIKWNIKILSNCIK